MSVLFDIIGSTLFTGILIVTILTINNNMVMGNYKSIASYEIQTQTIQLGRIMEYDIFKMGYNVPKTSPKIVSADTSFLKFYSDLTNSGTINTIQYQLGSYIPGSPNPRDRQLTRIVDGASLFISYNATRFYFSYYDSAMNKLATPVSAANLLKIRSVNIVMMLETPDPIDFAIRPNRTDTLYTGAYYEKLITARNLYY